MCQACSPGQGVTGLTWSASHKKPNANILNLRQLEARQHDTTDAVSRRKGCFTFKDGPSTDTHGSQRTSTCPHRLPISDSNATVKSFKLLHDRPSNYGNTCISRCVETPSSATGAWHHVHRSGTTFPTVHVTGKAARSLQWTPQQTLAPGASGRSCTLHSG